VNPTLLQCLGSREHGAEETPLVQLRPYAMGQLLPPEGRKMLMETIQLAVCPLP